MSGPVYQPSLTATMRRALEALARGRDPMAEPRPKWVTLKTMMALRKRGLVTYKEGRWQLR
jgi:hypothetical protein